MVAQGRLVNARILKLGISDALIGVLVPERVIGADVVPRLLREEIARTPGELVRAGPGDDVHNAPDAPAKFAIAPAQRRSSLRVLGLRSGDSTKRWGMP